MSDPAPIEDYLGAEPLLVARLKDRLADVPKLQVLVAADLAALQEANMPTPSVHVVYHGDADVTALAGGRAADVRQTWLAIVCIRNVAGDLRTGAAARQDAGPLIVRTARALMGWSPGAGYAALEMARAPYRTTYRQGRLYVPLAFTTSLRLRAGE